MSDNETYYYVGSSKFCLFYMYVYLFYTFIRLMLLRLCSQHYFMLVMNPVTFLYNNNNNNNNNNNDRGLANLQFNFHHKLPLESLSKWLKP